MNILIISGSFYPINVPRAFRTTELAKEFAKRGNDVTVLIPKTDYDYSEFSQKYKNIKFIFYKRDVLCSKSKISYYLGRILDIMLAYSDVRNSLNIEKVLTRYSGFDLLLSIAVPYCCHWGANKAMRKNPNFAKKWIADCGDPYMLNGTGDKHPFYLKYLEKYWCKKVDYITVPTEGAVNGYYPEFKNKIKVIPQGFDLGAIKLPIYTGNDVPTFCFAGVFIKGKRDPKLLLEFLCSLNIPFKFIVCGRSVEAFLSQYKDLLQDKLIIHESISRELLLPKLAKMDFLLNISNGVSVQTPSKLIDYTIAGRPILTIDSNDIKQDILNEFLQGNFEHKDKDIDLSKYDIRNIADQIFELCE
jgi:hypothetical protein